MLTLQAQMKELLRESDDLRLSRDEAISGAKETEKKLKGMETDVLRFQEVWKLQLAENSMVLLTGLDLTVILECLHHGQCVQLTQISTLLTSSVTAALLV